LVERRIGCGGGDQTVDVEDAQWLKTNIPAGQYKGFGFHSP